ncbi:uncharacterized protein JCM15063_002308 [Sporobolomyces koalae]|uniref:uncharacterized protein n=1 Tax=Sporobolomyces koalae TaxID=500713 RepID=UPI00317D099D
MLRTQLPLRVGSQSARVVPRSRLSTSAPSASSSSYPTSAAKSRSLYGATLVGAVLVGGAVVMYQDELAMDSERSFGQLMDNKLRSPQVFLWGRNADLVVGPPASATPAATSPPPIKKPAPHSSLSSLVLRDLKLSRTYGVAVDEHGDALQWGLGFSSTGAVERTLTGKDLVSVEATEEGKVFGLDRKGSVWVWSTSKSSHGPERVQGSDATPLGQARTGNNSNSLWWLGQGTIWGGSTNGDAIDCIKLGTDVQLAKGEKFVSLSSGQSHLLALTSAGRAFALPLCLKANAFGQLGVRQVSLLTPPHPGSAAVGSLTVRLEPDERINDLGRDKVPAMPKNLDPLLLNSSTMPTKQDPQPPSTAIRALPASYSSEQSAASQQEITLHPSQEEHSRLEQSIGFCTLLHEIPSLKGVEVVELVAGRNHSLARLGGRADGRVLGFGAGAYGQLGLGPSLSYPSIPVPTEIPFLRSPAYSATKPTAARCTKIAAGGNLSYFVVETERPATDLDPALQSGQGQFGGLGNGLWAHATHPLRVKTVSGLTEWNDSTGRVEAIKIKDVQAGETHVAVVLDNAVTFPDGSKFGRDVFTFGQNEFYQLGNGKRASLATPQHLPPLPYPSAVKRVTLPSGEKVVVPVKAEESLSSGTTSPMPHHRLQLATELAVPAGMKKLSKKAVIEECVVTGDSSTGVYWKIVQ